MSYGPALAQQDRRIEELESKCERLIFSCERTESERDEAKRARDAATAEVERLRDALTDMLAGWRYIRLNHGDLYGVGWDRCETAARAALTPAKEGD